MGEHRSKIIYACLAITESCWLFALIGIIGLIAGQGGSPLPWITVFLLLAAGMYTGWITMGMRGEPVNLAITLGLAGLACVYLAVAAGRYEGHGGFDMLWSVHLTGGDAPAGRWAGIIVALVGAILLWRRAAGQVADRYVEERLQRSFKIGMAVIAVAILVEQASGHNLAARAVLVPFFAVSLAGMSVARLPEHGARARGASWVRVITVSVLAVLGVGLLLGVVGGIYGSVGVRLLYRGWGFFVDGLLWIIRYPLELLVAGMLAFWMWVRGLLNPSGENIQLDPMVPGVGPAAYGKQTVVGEGSHLGETLVNILQYPLLIVLVIAIFLVLALTFRRVLQRKAKDSSEDREKIEGETDASADLAKLLKGLLPGWMRRHKEPALTWRYPDGEPGIGEVFRLYFDYLYAAIKHGMRYDPALTPAERVSALRGALPGAPVESVTERFNAACYGREPSDTETVAALRSALDQIETRTAPAASLSGG